MRRVEERGKGGKGERGATASSTASSSYSPAIRVPYSSTASLSATPTASGSNVSIRGNRTSK